jgi:hypothetical protein
VNERQSWSAWRLLGAAIAAASLIAGSLLHPGSASANSFPGWARSHYVSYSTALTTAFFYDRGCETGNGTKYQGGGVTNLAIILDFGGIAKSGSTYGASLWYQGTGLFKSTTWVRDRVENFASGLYSCSTTVPLFTILVGVHSDSGYVTAAHGTAWANMVDEVNNYILANGWDSQVWAMGAIDIESGFYAPVSQLKSWVNAYSDATDTSFLYNFGALSGCPTNAQYTTSPGYKCSGGSGCGATTSGCFYQNDYWYLSWGCRTCRNIGEIYNETVVTLPNGNPSDPNAQQWEGIRRYTYHQKGNDLMYISGSTTQNKACAQRSCNGTNNTPLTGWTHLHNSEGAYTPTEIYLAWSTDMMWDW